ncbi:adenylyltransferase/cytidyltransferase family protein [Candidatus Saccharibacteria bacterium]|nr:MAG: adenylyltransferase/cytidyltransferase family protein [Candidatus Saccharibacteria bacterium]
MKSTEAKSVSRTKRSRIGIYSGTFDPVHAGHVAFALQAAEVAQLEAVYFVPERVPRAKRQATHFAHRVAMVRRAVRPYPHLKVLELADKTFSVAHTLPRLQHEFPGAELVFLCGSDVLQHMAKWAYVKQFLRSVELCVGRRENESADSIKKILSKIPSSHAEVIVFESHAPAVSSSHIRAALREKRGAKGLLASVKVYANQEWLYL